jgi:hypothetical protein
MIDRIEEGDVSTLGRSNMIDWLCNVWAKDPAVNYVVVPYPELAEAFYYPGYMGFQLADWEALSDEQLENIWNAWVFHQDNIPIWVYYDASGNFIFS